MEFQSTLPRRERLFSIFNSLLFCIISIHAPAKGATTEICPKLPCSDISIHAPAKGATKRAYVFAGHVPNFNPRSREGSDKTSTAMRWKTSAFQSTLPRRERRHGHVLFDKRMKFQSTLPRRERRSNLEGIRFYSVYFNPRSREGSDCLVKCIKGYGKISIHAPAKGAT